MDQELLEAPLTGLADPLERKGKGSRGPCPCSPWEDTLTPTVTPASDTAGPTAARAPLHLPIQTPATRLAWVASSTSEIKCQVLLGTFPRSRLGQDTGAIWDHLAAASPHPYTSKTLPSYLLNAAPELTPVMRPAMVGEAF